MKKLALALLLTTIIVSCNKVQEQPDTNTYQQQVEWDHDTTSYDAVDVNETQEDEVSNGPTEWIWDGSPYDTIHIGDNLRITNIDGDKVYITLSK
jgi:hypothetical protein